MSINRRQLFLDRFLAYNRSRYKDNPDALRRLDRLTFEDMVFDGIAVDDSKPGELRRRVANFHADAQMMEGIDQRWTCASLLHRKVIPTENYTNSTPFASLDEFKKVNLQGVYQYMEDGMAVLGVVLATDSSTTEDIAPELITLLNGVSNYRLLTSELSIEAADRDHFPMHFTYMGETIVGRITVIRQAAEKPAVGNEMLGYYGEFPSDYLISSGVLAEMLGLGGSKLIAGADQVPWLKFAYFGKLVHIAKRAVSMNMTWESLNAAGLVDGSRVIQLGNKRYKVRLIHGAANELGNEWNDLLYRVHYQDPTGTFWERFTDEDMGLGWDAVTNKWFRNGSINFTQELKDAATAVVRGGGQDGASLTVSGTVAKNSTSQYYGWRPVLEYIGTSGLSDIRITDISSPIALDFSPEINTEFTGVLKPFGFEAETVPDAKIVPYVENDITLFAVKVDTATLGGDVASPVVTDVINDAVRSPRDVRLDKVIPTTCDIFAVGDLGNTLELKTADLADIVTRQQRPTIPLESKDLGNIVTKQVNPDADGKYNGLFTHNGTLHY